MAVAVILDRSQGRRETHGASYTAATYLTNAGIPMSIDPALGGGGGGPHDPGMEARVAALEAQAKTTTEALHRMELSQARIEAVLQNLATKAELTKVEGAISTLDAKVVGLEARVGRVEASVSTALNTAVGKAIGPAAFVGILAGSVTVLGGGAAFFAWLAKQLGFFH